MTDAASESTRLAELGRKPYEERFKDAYAEHTGELLAIDVDSSTAYLGTSPLEALTTARAANSNGHFHLVKIGFSGVYTLHSQTGGQVRQQFLCYPGLTTIHLELQPDIEERFASEAEAQGMPLERYVESLLTSAFGEDEELEDEELQRAWPA